MIYSILNAIGLFFSILIILFFAFGPGIAWLLFAYSHEKDEELKND